MQRIVVATDGSETAQRAVAWAADLATRTEAELVLLRVVAEPEAADERALQEDAARVAGPLGRARVLVDSDPSRGIVAGAEQEGADVLVVGNAGMGGRKQFLLGNVPNQISHSARCTVVIVNTTDGSVPPPAEEPEIEGRLLGRATQIGRVLTRLGLEARGSTNAERARALRAALEKLGPTFAKLGQIVSTRPDLMPPEFADELAKLQDKVAPLTEAEVVEVMERELRVPWEDVFADIDPQPLAAGTIGQVHRATLESGERVVVKVQRPNAPDEIMRDLGLLELFAEKALERETLRGTIDIPAIVGHLTESLRRELDFRQEAANADRMREVVSPYSRLAVPRIYSEFTTPRLLVLEFVDGGPVSTAPAGEERREAARQMLESFYRQLLTDGFFHADPHPGNLLWADGTIYFLDLGMVGELASELRELMVLLLLAFAREDPRFLAESILMLAGEERRADLDVEAMEHEFVGFIARFRGAALSEIRISAMLEGMIEIAARHGVRLPSALALSGKAFGQMQLAVGELDPELDPIEVVGSYLLRNVAERVRAGADPQKLYYEGQKLKLRLTRLLEAIERATGARPGPKLQVDFLGTSAIEEAIRHAGRRIALAAASAACVVATGVTAAGDTAGWVAASLAGVGAVFAGWLAFDLTRRR